MKRTLKRRILEIPTRCTLRGRCRVDARLSSKNKFARWNSGNSSKRTLKDSINTWHTMVMWWWARLTRQNCGTTCVLKWAQEIGNIVGLCLNFTDGQFLDQKFAFQFLSRTQCTLRNWHSTLTTCLVWPWWRFGNSVLFLIKKLAILHCESCTGGVIWHFCWSAWSGFLGCRQFTAIWLRLTPPWHYYDNNHWI